MPDPSRIIREPISRSHLAGIAREQFGDMVKADVDIRRRILAVGDELHSDDEALLLDDGSEQKDLWGINLYPDDLSDAWIEFDAMINVRPSEGNRSRGVDDESTRTRIASVVTALITD
jgi:hypothetical protein